MTEPPVITFTTDFGLSDPYVGVMKGVMLKINRGSVFVDITHEISPHSIHQAAYVIYSAFSYFPEGAIHICVVDPGVGSERRPIVFEAGGFYFVGPDNGLFTLVFDHFKPSAVYEITNNDFMEAEISGTFHGRDIFAPAAAWLSRGSVALSDFGPAVTDPVILDLPSQIQAAPNHIEGSIIYIDHFGNAITNISRSLLEKIERELGADGVEIELSAGVIKGILKNYSDAPNGESICATIGSWDTLEIFLSSGNASSRHGLTLNENVDVRFY